MGWLGFGVWWAHVMVKVALAALVLIVGMGSAALWFHRGAAPKLPPLRTVEVTRGDLEFTVDATGTVEPEEVVDVGAQIAGRIESLGTDPRDAARTIDYGSPVEVGTVLARIDDSLYDSEVEQARAQVASARALAESTAAQVAEAEANVQRAEKDLLQLQAKQYQADRDWKRAENLWNTSRSAISEAELDLARSTYQAADAAVGVGQAAIAQANAQLAYSKSNVVKAQADLGLAQASLKRAETNLGYCTIRSPVTGVIVDRRINVGQTVVSSLNSPSLFLIAKDLKRLEVWASVNEADVGNIRSGQAVEFTVDAFPGHVFRGVVAADQPRLNASMNQNIVTYTVVVDTDNSEGKLLPYLTADVKFHVATHQDVLLVPNAALHWRPSAARAAAQQLADDAASVGKDQDGESGAGTLWVVDGQRVRPVRVQELLSDGTRVEVAGDGLAAGARVVVGEATSSADTETKSPFMTQAFGNRRSAQ